MFVNTGTEIINMNHVTHFNADSNGNVVFNLVNGEVIRKLYKNEETAIRVKNDLFMQFVGINPPHAYRIQGSY